MHEPKTLADWKPILEELGFESKYYDYLDCELVGVDWIKGGEHIITESCYSKEYWNYIRSLPEGTEFEPDWSQCEVVGITIQTKEFGYPEGQYDFDGVWEGNIRLTEDSYFENFSSLSLDYFREALWMSRNPISAKNEIVKGYMREVDLFLQRYDSMLTKLGFVEAGSSFLHVGGSIIETEPYLEYSHCNPYNLGGIILSYNMFTKKLFWTKHVDNPEDNRRGLKPYFSYQLNVNDLDIEDFKSELIDHLQHYNLINKQDETD